MFKALQQFILHWLKRQFHGNPLVTQPGEYLPKVGQAYHVWLIAVASLISLAVIGSAGFVIGVLHGWF
ncbi:MAG: hypothetical protein ACD_41C00125G0002 [uncultured bacterium]|nr:MAG: hypothetical protein ACD_41C00125G0002 [uncultured bacterium]HBY73539.1 hypothetical protein [Candidatus Kerfeldbacteria bacterium]